MANSKKMNNSNSIGNNIRKFRKAKKMTQQQLAMELALDCSTISKYERNEINITPDIIIDLCNTFSCSPNDLFGVDNLTQYKINEKELIEIFNKIPFDQRKNFIIGLKYIVDVIL